MHSRPACDKKKLEQTNISLKLIRQNHKISKMAHGKARAVLEKLGLKYLVRKFDSENLTADLRPELLEDFKSLGKGLYERIYNA